MARGGELVPTRTDKATGIPDQAASVITVWTVHVVAGFNLAVSRDQGRSAGDFMSVKAGKKFGNMG